MTDDNNDMHNDTLPDNADNDTLPDNVVSIFTGRKSEQLSLAEIERRNAENKERMRQQRTRDNQGIIRSYRLIKR